MSRHMILCKCVTDLIRNSGHVEYKPDIKGSMQCHSSCGNVKTRVKLTVVFRVFLREKATRKYKKENLFID